MNVHVSLQSKFLSACMLAALFTASTGPLFSQPAADEDAEGETFQLDELTVTAATRTEKLASTLPVTTTVVPSESLERQFAISSDIGTSLAHFIPSYAPSRQKLTSNGESFRGRDPLYLIDGIPQSNPLRAGKRESGTIDPFFLEKIEAVHGSSAAQGMGATGGIINFVTHQAPATDGTHSLLELTGVTSARFKSDGFGGKAAALTATRKSGASLVAGVTYEHRPMSYDGDGGALGVDNVQGDTLDSDASDFFGKAAYDFNSRHRVELFFNHFNLEQNLEWVAVAGDRATGRPTISSPGKPNGLPAMNEVTSAAFTFTDRELFDGELTLNIFAQDFAAIYGASDTAATRNNFRLNGVPTLDQSRIEAKKHGLRTTWVRTFAELGNLGVVTGFDYLSDETTQRLVLTNRSWVPQTTYEGWSPYLQLEKPFGPVTLSGGIRYEIAKLDVPDFTTIESARNTFVRGGEPSFEQSLINLGLNWRATRNLSLYSSFAQGFGMPDVGRILRAINTPGRDVESFIDLKPIVTDNWEVGARLHGNNWRLGWNVFYSTAELGTRFVANPAGIFEILRERTEVYGTEFTGEKRLGTLGNFGGALALLEGRSDRNGNGSVETRLPAQNITAPKLTLYWDKPWTSRISTRLQSLTLFNRKDPDGIRAGDFHGYTVLDLLVTARLTDRSRVSLGVENLLDDSYITYFSQTQTGVSADNLEYFAGRGRTLSVRWRLEF